MALDKVRNRGVKYKNDIAWDVVVPVDYWKDGAPYPPEGTHERNNALDLYYNLYHGVGVVEKVQNNYYQRVSDFYADLYASFPPVVEGIADEQFAKYVNLTLTKAAASIGRNQSTYGVVILRPALNRQGQPIIQSLDPRHFYPTDEDDTDVYVQFSRDLGEGPTLIHIQLMDRDGSVIYTHAYNQGTIGAFQYDSDVIDGTGERNCIVAPRGGDDDNSDWGISMFDSIISIMTELNRRHSQNSGIFDIHSNPIFLYKNKEQANPDIYTDDNISMYNQSMAEDIILANKRGVPVQTLPSNKESAEYVSYDPQMQGVQAHIDKLEDAAGASVGLPAFIDGSDRSILASGTAMKRAYVKPYVKMHAAQNMLLPRLRDLVEVLGYLANVTIGDIEIVWDNPFDRLDEQAILQTSDPEAASDAVTEGRVATGSSEDAD